VCGGGGETLYVLGAKDKFFLNILISKALNLYFPSILKTGVSRLSATQSSFWKMVRTKEFLN
jgi:hypothetical protein